MIVKKIELDIFLMLLEKPTSVNEFSQSLFYTERNIRYFLNNLSSTLSQIFKKDILIKDKKNYTLLINPNEVDIFYNFLYKGNYIFSSSEREDIILTYFLFSKEPKISHLESILGVSRTTLKKDIHSVNHSLLDHSLEFFYFPKKVRIVGKEKKFRHLVFLSLLDLDKNKSSRYLSPKYRILEEIILDNIDNSWIVDVEAILWSIQEDTKIKYSTRFFNLLKWYLVTTLFRVDQGVFITRKNNHLFLRRSELFSLLPKYLGNYIPREYRFEYLHLVEYFLGGIFSDNDSTLSYENEDKVLVELYSYRLLLDLSLKLDRDLLSLGTIKEIYYYLLRGIYRIKNNLLIEERSKLSLGIEELEDGLVNFSKEHSLLDEYLRVEELQYIGESLLIHFKDDSKLDIDIITEIAKSCSNYFDEKKFKKLLTRNYDSFFKKSTLYLEDIPIFNTTFDSGTFNEILKVVLDNLYKSKEIPHRKFDLILSTLSVDSSTYIYYSSTRVERSFIYKFSLNSDHYILIFRGEDLSHLPYLHKFIP